MLITKGQSILDRKKKKERQRSLSNEERANGETNGNCSFVSWRTVFCRSDVIRKVLQPPRPLDPPPHSRRSKTNEGDPRGKDHRASICFHQSRPLLFSLSSYLFPRSSTAKASLELFFDHSKGINPPPPCSSDGVCIGCGSRFFPRLLHPRRARNKEDKQRVDVTS